MTVTVEMNGADFFIPNVTDSDWGPEVTRWIVATSAATLQKSGGAFTLTAEVDFGVGFGLKTLYYKTRTANPADAEGFRLARADSVAWRNQANSDNLLLAVNSSDQLTFNGVVIDAATVNDHGGLSGLSDDDHTQYALSDGTRDFTAAVTMKNSADATLRFTIDSGLTTGENAELVFSDRTAPKWLIAKAATTDTLFFRDKMTEDNIFEIRLDENSANLLTLGNDAVGIGLFTPLARLHVVGSGLFTGDITAVDGTFSGDLGVVSGTLTADTVTAANGSFSTSLTISGSPVSITDTDTDTLPNTYLPRGYIDGFMTQNDPADLANDIIFYTGTCRDSTNVKVMINNADVHKQLNAVWAEGSSQGGRASAISYDADTWYHMFAISKNELDSDQQADFGFDTDINAVNLLSDASGLGYQRLRRIGAVLTDGTPNIIAYRQYGDEFIWDLGIQDATSTNQGTSAVSHIMRVPPGLSVRWKGTIVLKDVSAPGTLTATLRSGLPPDLPAPSTSNFDQIIRGTGSQTVSSTVELVTDITQKIKTRWSASTTDTFNEFYGHGWVDPRGKDIIN